jgi:hypothetical protein
MRVHNNLISELKLMGYHVVEQFSPEEVILYRELGNGEIQIVDAYFDRIETTKLRPHTVEMVLKARERRRFNDMLMSDRIKARYAPGGDKYESIKADEQWEKSHPIGGDDD